MAVLVVGSVALDSVETPFGKADNVLGGSGNFFAASASHLAPVQLVGVIGNDYPIDKLEQAFGPRAIDLGAAAIGTTSIRRRRSRRTSASSRTSGQRSPSSFATPHSSSLATSIRGCSSRC
jgi:sugar/nucleoside kinase (ribokinase family)